MDGIEYYKSLISDEEVIKALVKESKARNELLREKTRVRPNLNFFQRTVTNLVTSNKRASTTKELFKEETTRKVRGKVKSPDTSVREILPTTDTNQSSECECGQPTKPQRTSSRVEGTYKEISSKYLASAAVGKTSNKSVAVRKFNVNDTQKSKGIVFNLNFSKSRLEGSEAESEVSESPVTNTVNNCNDSGVISISDSESD